MSACSACAIAASLRGRRCASCHAALQAVATADATAPGVDFPMHNGIFMSQAYRWIQDATNSEVPDYSSDSEEASWHELEKRWYTSGRPFRDLDRLAGSSESDFPTLAEPPEL